MPHIFKRKEIVKLVVFGALFLIIPFALIASDKRRNVFYDNYIEKYKKLAINHMDKYKIPASITLSQGLLESGAGNSPLTLKSNNHFGIKCNNGWKGESVIAADDIPNDCFRKYKKAEDSFNDHSRFLTEKQRYRDLFSLDITDYRGWARGLQKAGYATDKAYANKLIKIIEDYELYQHDQQNEQLPLEAEEIGDIEILTPVAPEDVRHVAYKTNGLVYIVAKKEDSYASIAKEFGFKVKDLCEYNEAPENFPIQDGDLIYFQKKRKKSDKPYYEHVVVVGESMYSISQLYGVQVNNLYKMNKKDFDYVPVEGDILRLR